MTPLAAEAIPVLLVDDDRHLLRTLADILRARGYEPRTASTGHEGLHLVSDSPFRPAIALVDMRLPDMDGMEVVRQLRASSSLIEVVVLTGHASIESAVGALREQSCDYLVKPVAPAQLLDTLGRATERWMRHRAEQALRRSEERFRRLIEGIGEIVFLLDEDLTVGYVSPSVTRALGLAPAAVTGRSFLDLAAAQPPSREIAAALRLLVPERALDFTARHCDGSERLLQLSVTDLLDHAEVEGLVVTARDVTEQRHLERQALQAHRLESIGRLAGGVAHDFNNILSVILGASELALREPQLPADACLRLGEIRSAAERASRLTRQLLQFAKRQPGEARLVGLRDVTRDMEPLLLRLLGDGGELALDLGADPLLVRVAPSQLEQILMNLVANARDAMPDGGRITIATRVCESDAHLQQRHAGLPAGRYALLAVADSGVGMTEEVRARALEPFFTTKPPGSGTGLGLSICYGIVKQSGGSVALDSAPGKGSCVEIVLPLSEQAVPDAPPAPDRSSPRGTESILLVEDDAAVRGVTEPMLARLGYRVTSVASGDEALAWLQARGSLPDLVITDVVMPRMSGTQLARALRRKVPQIKLLFLSGYTRESGAELALSDPLLGKPFSLPELARVVRAVLDTPAAAARSA